MWGNIEAKCLGDDEIDDQLKLGRLCDRQIGGLLAFENLAGVNTSLTIGMLIVPLRAATPHGT